MYETEQTHEEESSANEPETESRQQSQRRPGQSLSRENDYGGGDQGDCDKHKKKEKFCMTFLLLIFSTYNLIVAGYRHSSTAPNGMYYDRVVPFTTLDRDNDSWEANPEGNCARETADGGGWWYFSCATSFPTALIGKGGL